MNDQLIQPHHLMTKVHRPMKRRDRRQGLSIMEVLFAIAVLTVGMLGVASILPVATNNAAMTLQTDRAVEEIGNRIAADLAELSESFEEVVVANNSQEAFRNGIPRFEEVNTATFSPIYDFQGSLPQPALPDAFCIDPWFLTAAGTLRDDESDPTSSRNGYDRTMFPCFDPRLHPFLASPTAPIRDSITGATVDLPRFTRIGLTFNSTSLLAAINAEAAARRSDDFSITIPDDRTLGPGLFVQRANNSAFSLSKNTVSSRYSSIVLMSRSAPGSSLYNAAVVTMVDRHVVTNEGGAFDGNVTPTDPDAIVAHNLRPYTAWLPDDPSLPNSFPTEQNQIFPGEMLGYVTESPRPMKGGGGGEFIFRTSRFVKPEIDEGDWLMLMRREYNRVPNSGTPGIIQPGTLKFGWYRISDVVRKPELLNGNANSPYTTQVAVDGPDWTFHPTQTQVFPGVSGQPYYGVTGSTLTPQPSWASPPGFDFDDFTAGDPAGYNHIDYGTLVVLMPDVISVKQLQVQIQL